MTSYYVFYNQGYSGAPDNKWAIDGTPEKDAV